MTNKSRNWNVAIVGLNSAGLFLLEQLSLATRIRVMGVFDPDPKRQSIATSFGCQDWGQLITAVKRSDVDTLVLADHFSADFISDAIVNGKHLVFVDLSSLTPQDLIQIVNQSKASEGRSKVTFLRRASAEFSSALAAKKTGRLGDLHSVRFTSCEKIADKQSAGFRGFFFHWLDQLLAIVDSQPIHVFAKRSNKFHAGSDDGLCTMIEFASGCTAQIDLQTQSRLSHRTGWMLEGTLGSYRGNRFYTVTTDGEIVDEPLQHERISTMFPSDDLIAFWEGLPSSMPNLDDAVRVLRLLKSIELSAESGEVIRL